MGHETGPQAAVPSTPLDTDHHGAGVPGPERVTHAVPDRDEPLIDLVARTSPRSFRRIVWLGTGVAILAACGIAGYGFYSKGLLRDDAAGASTGSTTDTAGTAGALIPVNTVRPQRKTIERTLVQPGTVQPIAQTDLYAKVAGYLKRIQRDPTPQMIAKFVAVGATVSGQPVEIAPRLAIATHLALWQAPQKDIGSPVVGGEVLLEIATPERLQEIAERESLLLQREAELESARTALATFEAAVEAAKAQKSQAASDTRRYEFEHIYRAKELARLKELVSSGSVTPGVADEKQNQVDAALAAWESSQARVSTAQAELTVAISRQSAASADLRVKELLVQVARDELHLAQILADYSRIRAPFDGIIIYRGVDEGDFVQNATSGQARRLMTVAAIDTVKLVLHVPEKDAPWVQVGTEATVVLDALPGIPVEGRVARTAHALDPQTRTMQVEIDLENRDHRLLPGMYGEVTLVLQRFADAQAIPATALYSRKGENFVLQVRDGVAYRQRVRIRYDDGKEAEVVKLIGSQEVALEGSEELIVSNKGEIAEGQRVKATPLGGE